MNGPRNNGRGRRRGMTLLEVLVASAVAVAVVGMALGILIAVNTTAREAIGRDSQVQQAQLVMRELRAVFEGVVWPEDLDRSPWGDTAYTFNPDAVALVSTHLPSPAGGFCRYVFSPGQGEAGAPAKPGFRRLEPGRADDAGAFRPLGGEFETTVEFRYATELGADLKPVWTESLADGQRPRLVWVRVVLRDPRLKDRTGKPAEVRLETAVAL